MLTMWKVCYKSQIGHSNINTSLDDLVIGIKFIYNNDFMRDEGSGIIPEMLPIIFERFTGKSMTGMGVRLFIAKSVVEAHGGKIRAYNNSIGRGATFAFTLPS